MPDTSYLTLKFKN